MVELPPIAWTAIGAIVGALPSLSIAFWRECRERRVQKHELAMQKLDDKLAMILKGMERDYGLHLTDDSDSLQPPSIDPNADSQG